MLDALLPPAWEANGQQTYLLGTDSQGRDLYSAILYGTRVSLLIGLASVLLSMLIGIVLGLISGYAGGRIDAFIMRIADVQLSFPAILIALLIDGVARAGGLPREMHELIAFPVLIGAIALAGWPQYARTVRGSTLVEKNREYVQAARVIGVASPVIMFRHVLPNVLGPVLVLATVHLATAIITEATLSFLVSGGAADGAVAGDADPHRQRFPVFRRVVDHHFPGRGAGAAGAVGQPAGRLAARCAQPPAELR